MIVIRDAQLEVFRAAAAERFERRLMAAVAHSFPREFAELGVAGLQPWLRLGRERAARHGWRSEQAVYLHLCLMLMLGAGFDTDPWLPWVAAELARQPEAPALDRAFALHGAAMAHLDAVAGEDNEHLLKALIRLRDFDIAAGEAIPLALARLYPQKAAALVPDALPALAQAAARKAQQHGLAGDTATTLMACLMFMLGHDFDTDPALPWAPAALAADEAADARMQRLYRGAMAHLHNGLA